MDTEELEEMAFHRKHGRPETTRGPYYHKTWWESYKGAVKGILGGIAVGGMIGAISGGAIIGVIALTGGLPAIGGVGVGGILAATTLFGMHEGKEKFEKVGITTGAVAAAQEISEVRTKTYMRDKLTDLTNEVRELKAAIAGKIDMKDMHTDAAKSDRAAIFDESDFVSTHTTSDDPGDDHKLVYPKVAVIGALVGMAVAAVVGMAGGGFMGGPGEHFIAELMSNAFAHEVSAGVANTTLIASGAALGGSFGVSRDIFRKVFDVTDCWFMGVGSGNCNNQEIAEAKGKVFEPLETHKPRPVTAQYQLDPNVIPPGPKDAGTPSPEISNVFITEPQSTYFRDKISKEEAQLALLGMDHTSAMRH